MVAPSFSPTLPATLSIAPDAGVRDSIAGPWRQFAQRLRRRTERMALEDHQAACAAFIACLSDLASPESRALCQLLAHAASLDELWHLRPEVYRQLALCHSQAEAERRMATLNGFFNATPQRTAVGTVLLGT